MKKLMILGASVLQLPAIQKAKEMGFEVVAVDMNPDAVGFKVDGVIKEVISTIDIPAVVDSAKRHKIDGVMTLASDMPMRTVAAVTKELGFKGVTADTALKATDKAVMRETFKEHGVPSPEYYKVTDKQEFLDAVKGFMRPFIVKPADNSGSRGVFLIEDFSDMEAAEKAYEYSKKYSRNGNVVVEEYMTGPEVSVETLTVGGQFHVLQITDKMTTGAPHFVEIGHSQPSCLSEEDKRAIRELAEKASRAVGIVDGPAHAEIIVAKDGPKMVEIGARMGGGCITTHLVPLSTGVDMTKSVIEMVMGQIPDVSVKFEKGAAIRFIIPPVGKVVSVSGVEEAGKLDGVQEVVIQCEIGQQVGMLENGASRIGYVIAQADTAENAIKICEKALEKIVIKAE